MFILSGFFGAIYILLSPFISRVSKKWLKLGWGLVLIYETMRVGYRLIMFGKL